MKWFVICLGVLYPSYVQAQVLTTTKEVLVEVVKDPTTYATAPSLYVFWKLDWDSSQPLYGDGVGEASRYFTKSGKPFDEPVSFAEGNKRIAIYSLEELGWQALTNAGIRVGERLLVHFFPSHETGFKKLSFVARIATAAGKSYYLDHRHFDAWRENVAAQKKTR